MRRAIFSNTHGNPSIIEPKFNNKQTAKAIVTITTDLIPYAIGSSFPESQYFTLAPPSTRSVAPVTNADSSEAKNNAA